MRTTSSRDLIMSQPVLKVGAPVGFGSMLVVEGWHQNK